MDFEKFCEEIKQRLTDTIPNDYGIIIRKVSKNNGVSYRGISIHAKDRGSIAPTFYLDGLYEDYVNEIFTIDEICEKVYSLSIGKLNEIDNSQDNFQKVINFENVKGDIILKLVNYELNKDYLKNVPHTRWNDLAIIYNCQMKINNNQGNVIVDGGMNIDNRLMNIWNISKEELHSVALENIKRNYYPMIIPMSKMLLYILEDTFDAMNPPVVPEEKDKFFVTTNKEKLYGANALLLPDVIQESEELSDRDVIYIIPSSIHEIILVPADEDFTQEELLEMIQSVNDTDLDKTDVLSYSLYKWERNSNEITVV